MDYYGVFFVCVCVALSLPGGSVHKESKQMATDSNILAWEIPRTEEPGGLQAMGSQKSQTRLRNYTTT